MSLQLYVQFIIVNGIILLLLFILLEQFYRRDKTKIVLPEISFDLIFLLLTVRVTPIHVPTCVVCEMSYIHIIYTVVLSCVY